jgi:hypothetical protein
VELRPLLITRIANVLPGGVLAGFGVEWWFQATGDWQHLGAAVLTAAGAILAVRGYRVGVRYENETLTVRGIFRSRKISRSSISSITALPAVRWSSKSGRSVWTPIIAFAELDTVIPPVARRNEEAIEELERWHAGSGPANATPRRAR